MTRASHRVLVLDDEPGIGRLLAAALAHHVTEVFTKPSAALARAGEVCFDFVFCDFSMPEMTGIEFHDAFREIQPDLGEHFVLMTGSAPCVEIQDFLQRSRAKLLEKPFELRELVSLVDAALSAAPAGGHEPIARAAAHVASCVRQQALACAATVRALRTELRAMRKRAQAQLAEAALDRLPTRAAVRLDEAMFANLAADILQRQLAAKGAELKRLRAEARCASQRSAEHRGRPSGLWRIAPARRRGRSSAA